MDIPGTQVVSLVPWPATRTRKAATVDLEAWFVDIGHASSCHSEQGLVGP